MSVTPAAGEAPWRRAVLISGIVLLPVVTFIDTTIVAMVLPRIQGAFSVTQEETAWVITAYLVSTAVAMPAVGWLSDRFGRRRLILVSLVSFTVASVLSGLSTNMTELVAFRIVQGASGAPILPLSQTFLFDMFTRERHARALSIWGAVATLGSMIGPALGGYLAEAYVWRTAFFAVVPIGAYSFLIVLTLMEERPHRPPATFDWLGFLMLALGIGALQLVLDRGARNDWFSSVEIVLAATVAAIGLYQFLVHTATSERPFLSPALLVDRNLTIGLLMVFLYGVTQFASLTLIPPFVQNVMDFPIDRAGYVIAPRGFGNISAMVVISFLAQRIDPRLLVFAGLLALTAAAVMLTGFTADVPAPLLTGVLVLQGLGLGLGFIPLTTMAFATLAPALRPQGAAFYNLLQGIGGSLGVAALVTALGRAHEAEHSRLVEFATPFNELFREPFLPSLWSLDDSIGLARLDVEINRQAEMLAYGANFQILTLLPLCSIPLLLLLRDPRQPR